MYRSFCFKSFGLFKSWSERLFNVFVACLCRDQTSDVKFSFTKTLTAEAEKLFKNEAFLSVIPAKMLHCWNNDEKINCNGWKACGVFVVSTFSFPLYIFMEISSKHRTRTKLPLVSLFFFFFFPANQSHTKQGFASWCVLWISIRKAACKHWRMWRDTTGLNHRKMRQKKQQTFCICPVYCLLTRNIHWWKCNHDLSVSTVWTALEGAACLVPDRPLMLQQ